MTFKLGKKSRERLAGVHPDLTRVVERAIELTEVDFTVLEGIRSKSRQEKLVASGASQTMNSRHLTGHAVDLGALVGGQVRWDWALYLRIAGAVRTASLELGIPIRWGGTWGLLSDLKGDITADVLHKRFPDGPHYELPSKDYPA
jgi:peptidoglycan L-alanyl-D-glutamate endopeptidase CwlK